MGTTLQYPTSKKHLCQMVHDTGQGLVNQISFKSMTESGQQCIFLAKSNETKKT